MEVELDNTDEFGIELGFQSPVLFDRSNISNLTTFQTTSSQNASTTVANNVLVSSQATPGFQFGDPSSGLGTNPHRGRRKSARRNSPTWDWAASTTRSASADWCWPPAPNR